MLTDVEKGNNLMLTRQALMATVVTAFLCGLRELKQLFACEGVSAIFGVRVRL